MKNVNDQLKRMLELADVSVKNLTGINESEENSDNFPTKFFAPNEPPGNDELRQIAAKYEESMKAYKEMQKEYGWKDPVTLDQHREFAKKFGHKKPKMSPIGSKWIDESEKKSYSKEDLVKLGVKFTDEDSEATIKSVCNLFDTIGTGSPRDMVDMMGNSPRVKICNDMLEKYRNRGKK